METQVPCLFSQWAFIEILCVITRSTCIYVTPLLSVLAHPCDVQRERTHTFFLFFFNNCIVPLAFLPWEIKVAFPRERQLWQSRVNQPPVHAGCFSVSIIHRTLIWTTGSLTHAQMLMHMIAHGGCRHGGSMDTLKESAQKADSGTKILCCTRESNLGQQHAAPTLYQLSYIPAKLVFVLFCQSFTHSHITFYSPCPTSPKKNVFTPPSLPFIGSCRIPSCFTCIHLFIHIPHPAPLACCAWRFLAFCKVVRPSSCCGYFYPFFLTPSPFQLSNPTSECCTCTELPAFLCLVALLLEVIPPSHLLHWRATTLLVNVAIWGGGGVLVESPVEQHWVLIKEGDVMATVDEKEVTQVLTDNSGHCGLGSVETDSGLCQRLQCTEVCFSRISMLMSDYMFPRAKSALKHCFFFPSRLATLFITISLSSFQYFTWWFAVTHSLICSSPVAGW